MRMRQINALSMQEALSIARKEMGDDAIMLRSENNTSGVVVTFGVEVDDLPEPEFFADVAIEAEPQIVTFPKPLPPAPATTPSPKQVAPRVNRHSESALHYIEEILLWHGVPSVLHEDLMHKASAANILSLRGPDGAEALLVTALETHIRFSPISSSKQSRAVMLVGGHGAGKTFAIAKLATDAVKRKLPVRVITTDTLRAGAIEQLSAFTSILDAKLDVAQSRAELKTLLRDGPKDDLILIDSAGCNPYDFAALKQLGEFAKLHDIEPVLVMPLGIDANEAQEIAGVFSFLDIERILITRADCARRFGGVLSAIIAGQYSVSHISQSNHVGDGCPAGNAELLAQLLLRPLRERLS